MLSNMFCFTNIVLLAIVVTYIYSISFMATNLVISAFLFVFRVFRVLTTFSQKKKCNYTQICALVNTQICALVNDEKSKFRANYSTINSVKF